MRTKTTVHPPHRRGFTLIEILIVIAIIAVLAALGAQMAGVAMIKAKNMAEKQAITALVQAIDTYYDDYGHLPQVGSGGTSADLTTQSDSGLMNILQAVGDGKAQNPKGIRYYKGKPTKSNSPDDAYGGLLYVGQSSAELFDVWKKKGSLKRHYQVVLDSDLDGEIQHPFDSGQTFYDHLVLVWSTGRDGQHALGAANDQKNRDNVYSWR